MDKKVSLVIAIAIVLIVVGGYLIFTNPYSSDVSGESLTVPLKTHDFEADSPWLIKMENHILFWKVTATAKWSKERIICRIRVTPRSQCMQAEFTRSLVLKGL